MLKGLTPLVANPAWNLNAIEEVAREFRHPARIVLDPASGTLGATLGDTALPPECEVVGT
jgi:hypothetical protein